MKMNNKEAAEAKAKALLNHEIGVDNPLWSYDFLRVLGHSGYADYYHSETMSNESLSYDAKKKVLDKFARYDYILGTTESELVEVQAKALLVQEVGWSYSYQELREVGWSGYAKV